MRKLCDHLGYYAKSVVESIQQLLVVAVVALSFLCIILSFGYTVYYLFFSFCFTRVIAGIVSLYAFIHLNKSVQP